MNAPSLFAKLVRALRHRDEPLHDVARKVARNVRALVLGRAYLRSCSSLGRRPRAFGRPRIDNRGTIRIGDDFALGCAFGTSSIVATSHGVVSIGDATTVNYGVSIRAARAVRIGSRVLVGPFCVIEDSDVPDDRGGAAAIDIGDDVWLAARVVVRPGATIGAGAVIAAGSVVEGTIPPNAVASGAPAKVLRVRTSPTPTEAHHEAVA